MLFASTGPKSGLVETAAQEVGPRGNERADSRLFAGRCQQRQETLAPGFVLDHGEQLLELVDDPEQLGIIGVAVAGERLDREFAKGLGVFLEGLRQLAGLVARQVAARDGRPGPATVTADSRWVSGA